MAGAPPRTGSPKIAYLVQDFPPEVGAGPARVLEMSQRWLSRGAQVTVVTGMPNRRLPGRGDGAIDVPYRGRASFKEDWEGVPTIRSWLFTNQRRGTAATVLSHLSFSASSFVNALARRVPFDVLIASSPPFLPQISGALLAGLRRKPLVLEIRDLWPDYMLELGMLENATARRSLFALERRLLQRATRVVVVTESFRARVAAKGVPADRIDVIPNGVDLSRYYREPSPPPVEALRRRDGETIVGYLGTFGRGQGLTSVINAARILCARQHDVRFVLAGGGPDAETLKADASKLPPGRVTLLPPVHRDQTRAFYNNCDVCLVPLAPVAVFQDTIPSKIFEVMACERPLVASLSGEGARIVSQSGGGLASPPGDPEGLAHAIEQMMTLPAQERQAMGTSARAYVAANYDRMLLADRYLEILTSLSRAEANRR